MFVLKILSILFTVLFVLISAEDQSCSQDSLAFYKLKVFTYWSREKFPKHYPDTRPIAQWSKLFGLSHNDNINLFQLGSLASKGLQEYAELGRTDTFEKIINVNNTLSQFYAPPMQQGVGIINAHFFVDANFPKISFVLKIHPSPDWFVGVDSLSLCQNRSWIENKTIFAEPMDAGTDQGFTFTAPDYENDPYENIFKYTHIEPNEPYGSFYNRSLSALPAIAKFELTKVNMYSNDINKNYPETDNKTNTPIEDKIKENKSPKSNETNSEKNKNNESTVDKTMKNKEKENATNKNKITELHTIATMKNGENEYTAVETTIEFSNMNIEKATQSLNGNIETVTKTPVKTTTLSNVALQTEIVKLNDRQVETTAKPKRKRKNAKNKSKKKVNE